MSLTEAKRAKSIIQRVFWVLLVCKHNKAQKVGYLNPICSFPTGNEISTRIKTIVFIDGITTLFRIRRLRRL